MAGIGDRQLPACNIDLNAQNGREVAVLLDAGESRELLQDGPGSVPVRGVSPYGVEEGAHDGGRAHSSTGYIADDEECAAVSQRDDVIPISADVHALDARQVAHGRGGAVEV